ncbi:hypothetical protein BGZ65_008518 [Modicella reniformis]|uniref:Uncharacterized protein n=1 Tax=Modicella reniformis TaxID=1440133 RepID=A0A9P6MAY0_9FUNG|nr:hypothetical protein BGZ65_008518 [Modicella reniformis]
MLEAYPNGLRSLVLNYVCSYDSFWITIVKRGTLARSLLKYSANTIEFLHLRDVAYWIHEIEFYIDKPQNEFSTCSKIELAITTVRQIGLLLKAVKSFESVIGLTGLTLEEWESNLDSICEHLVSKDIWRCYRVNRTWRDIFGPHRYKEIKFASLDSSQTRDILNNAYRIQRLIVDLSDAGYFIDAPCTQLRELNCMNMGHLPWEDEDDTEEIWYPIHIWREINPSDNALLLIGKNPGLQSLDVSYHAGRIHLRPFTSDILSALSSHPSLIRIRIDLLLDLTTYMKLLSHLPRSLQELELDIGADIPYSEAYATTIPLQLSQPTNLRRLSFMQSLENYEDLLLIPLLKQSPLLEYLVLPQVLELEFASGIIPALIGHCPNLQSFQHRSGGGDEWFESVCTLLEAYPNGLRRLALNYSWYPWYPGPSSEGPNSGALVRALLKHSTNTIEDLELRGHVDNWGKGIISLLERCPNLRKLRVRGTYQSLDDIVRQSSWRAVSPRTTDSIALGFSKPSAIESVVRD